MKVAREKTSCGETGDGMCSLFQKGPFLCVAEFQRDTAAAQRYRLVTKVLGIQGGLGK